MVIVYLANYSEDDVREMFERLQNGTSLNAAEKRHAIAGGMSDVVRELARHRAYPAICEFTGARYAYEDTTAKVLHELLARRITDIRPKSIRRTYEQNSTMTTASPGAQKVSRILNFLYDSFNGTAVKLRKYAILSLAILVGKLLDEYNLSSFRKEFGDWFGVFETQRIENENRDEDNPQYNSTLAAYSENARNDSPAALAYRDNVLTESLFSTLINLEPKDPTRAFSREQRFYIYERDGRKCKLCETPFASLEEMHADHVLPHSRGGKTTVSNGQALCIQCNLRRGAPIN